MQGLQLGRKSRKPAVLILPKFLEASIHQVSDVLTDLQAGPQRKLRFSGRRRLDDGGAAMLADPDAATILGLDGEARFLQPVNPSVRPGVRLRRLGRVFFLCHRVRFASRREVYNGDSTSRKRNAGAPFPRSPESYHNP